MERCYFMEFFTNIHNMRDKEKEVRKKREGKKEKLNMSEKITQFQILLF